MLERLSRKEKEDLFIKKMTELQIRWGNPLDGDWDFVRESTDEALDRELENTIGQLRFEKGLSAIGTVFRLVLWFFVIVGFAGLLRFGWRQIF